jgi:hypothetical protein
VISLRADHKGFPLDSVAPMDIFDAHIVEGPHTPDHDETLDVAWLSPAKLADVALTDFTVALLSDPTAAILRS